MGDTVEKKISLLVGGMDCTACALPIENGIKALPGVKKANVNYVTGKVFVVYDDGKTNEEDIKNAIEDSGYEVIG